MKIYIPSKSEDPVLELNNFNLGQEGLKKDLTSAEFNWPDKEWIDTQDSPVYDFRIEGEVEPNLTGFHQIGILVFEGYSFEEEALRIEQDPTTLISVSPDSVTLAADGTESSVQLSTVGAWTVE